MPNCLPEFEHNQRRTSTAKRGPLSTSNQQVWFLSKDTTSAILSSKTIAEKFKGIPSCPMKKAQHVIKKPSSKTKLVDKVPKFKTVPDKYHNLCRKKSVNEIMGLQLCENGNEEHERYMYILKNYAGVNYRYVLILPEGHKGAVYREKQ